jgi:hypothetical protein
MGKATVLTAASRCILVERIESPRLPFCTDDFVLMNSMSIEELLPLFLKAIAVGVLLGGVAYRLKQRSFFLWAGIGAAAAAIFPGLSLVALIVLAMLPNGQKKP